MTEREKIMWACLVCGVVVGMIMLTLPVPPLGSRSELVSVVLGAGTVLVSLLTMLVVFTIIFGREWFGD